VLIPLLGGSYFSRSGFANAQRCVNMFPEKNTQDAVAPVVHFPTPGLTLLGTSPTVGPWRGLYVASNGKLFGVCGSNLYYIDRGFNCTSLITLSTFEYPATFADNGTTMVVCDNGSAAQVDLNTNAASAMNALANWQPSSFVAFLDTFLLFTAPGKRTFFTSLSNTIQFDPLYVASKTGASDPIKALLVNHRDIWLIGSKTTEIWNNVGGAQFPFQRQEGVFIQHGTIAPYSAAWYNLQVFFLSQDNNGECIVLMGSGYQVQPVTKPPQVYAFSQYNRVDDAVGFCYQQSGHPFYVLTFPSANKTWVYDISTDEWHEWVCIDQFGHEHRHRSNCTAYAYGFNVVGDFANGKLYALDEANGTDEGQPIIRRRGFPYIAKDGHLIYHGRFMADIEVGTKT
jgi:hypothetical protein